MQDVARSAVREYVERHSREDLLNQVLDEELPRYARGPRPPGPVRSSSMRKACSASPDESSTSVLVRDHGLLSSAVARPQASAIGEDVYPDLESKAAALLQSLVRNHPLIDGNKRLGLAAAIALLGVNGRRLTLSNEEAYDFVIAVATGQLSEIDAIAAVVRRGSEPR